MVLFSQQASARMPSANRECSTCHIMWLNEFKQTEKPTLVPYEPRPVVESGKQDVASTEQMCFSCHDGFVLDSRFMFQEGKHKHPVGRKPTKHIKIPMIEGKQMFPLNDDGKVYCGTCHSAHGVDWGQTESVVFLRMKNVNSSLCLTCHEERGTGPGKGNHPVNMHVKQPPNTLFRAGSKFGKDGRVICESCHRPHGADGEKILVLKNNESNLCRSCHEDKKTVNQTKHNMALSAPTAVNIKGKTASETGPCSVCHIPHDAKGAALWARDTAKSPDPAAAPCLGCHSVNGLANKKPIKNHSHPTGVAINKLGITVKNSQWQTRQISLLNKTQLPLPLYDKNGQRTGHGGNISCGTCHDPHVWSTTQIPPPGFTEVNKQEGDGLNSFLRIGQGNGSELCINCHVDKQSLFFTKHNREIGFKDVPVAEGGQQGICAECHVAHNGNGPYMQASLPGKGEGVLEKICTACHKQGGIAESKQTGRHSHPVGVGLDKIQAKTKLPLFTAEGKRHPQGNVDCGTCHNVHQWDPKNRQSLSGMKAEIDGTGMNSFLRIANDPRSSLCTECHTPQASVIRSEHDMNITGPKSTNFLGQTIHRTGICGGCHSVHNANIATRLWAREPFAKADNVKESLCRGCHNPQGLAHAKVPPVLSHPQQVMAWSDRIRQFLGAKILPYIPVLSTTGQPESMEQITCTSCHNPHRWSSRHDKAPGKNTEGNVLSSFLRNRSSENIVCADCHGRDALFRYKYFHSKTSRAQYPLSE